MTRIFCGLLCAAVIVLALSAATQSLAQNSCTSCVNHCRACGGERTSPESNCQKTCRSKGNPQVILDLKQCGGWFTNCRYLKK
jgi:hypothetical protein